MFVFECLWRHRRLFRECKQTGPQGPTWLLTPQTQECCPSPLTIATVCVTRRDVNTLERGCSCSPKMLEATILGSLQILFLGVTPGQPGALKEHVDTSLFAPKCRNKLGVYYISVVTKAADAEDRRQRIVSRAGPAILKT
ncbi:hypothetical protein GWK47_028669 [Chionoecetes opilio]|uniref:Uncharacterized protein n=1 Tax=Chionoecetes opilio TaxID=41210 RepID=A0A8J4YKZ3_CHIOP|nr:hypothetical protein GWK47_028669 [Chionoecetes opilio]